MIFFLAFCFVIIIPLSLFYFKYGKHKTYQTFFSKGGFFWMTLLLIWGTKSPNLVISEIDFVVLTFLFISLSFLASLCLEDIMHLSVPVKTLFLAIFFLINKLEASLIIGCQKTPEARQAIMTELIQENNNVKVNMMWPQSLLIYTKLIGKILS